MGIKFTPTGQNTTARLHEHIKDNHPEFWDSVQNVPKCVSNKSQTGMSQLFP